MEIFRRGYVRITTIVVFITLSIEAFIINSIHKANIVLSSNPSMNSIYQYLIEILLGVGIYSLLYQFIMLLFDNKLWIYLYKQLNINGVWYHMITDPKDPSYIRYGRMEICQKFSEVKITGTNYSKDFNPRDISIWWSDSIEFHKEGKITFSYSVTRSGEKTPFEKRGNMQLTIQKDKKGHPVRIQGVFEDSHPSDIRGSIICDRDVVWKDKIPTASTIQVKSDT